MSIMQIAKLIYRSTLIVRFVLIFIIVGVTAGVAMANGLKFYHSGYEIDKRTSYHVFDREHPAYTDSMVVAFDMALYPDEEFGYIMRMNLDEGSKNLIFNLFYDYRGDRPMFRFNQEGKSEIASMTLDGDALTGKHWFKVRMSFDFKSGMMTLDINDNRTTGRIAGIPEVTHPCITFGKSDYVIDVPAVAISDINICGGGPSYRFMLNEKEGNAVHAVDGKVIGAVDNPYWLINDAFHWSKKAELASDTQAGVTYDTESGNVYYFNSDSIHIYNTLTDRHEVKAYADRCPVTLFLAYSYIDRNDGRMYVFEAIDKDQNGKPVVASLDLDNLSWRVESYEELPMQMHHLDYFYSQDTGRYTIFGGFGNMSYSNRFYTYDKESSRWEDVGQLSGDRIEPRYFAAVGYCESNHNAYIFGGMGNESGEQAVGRRYFYDLYRYDIRNGSTEKLWEIDGPELNTVPARGMVLTDDSTFYVLRYPESISNSSLRLYRFSVKDGSHEILGDSIDIKSDKITTNAHLYYNDREGRLYVTVQESPDDISSTLKVYSLVFPPVSHAAYYDAGTTGTHSSHLRWVLIVITFVACVIAGVTVASRRKKSESANKPSESGVNSGADTENDIVASQVVKTEKSNSIYLFGDFTVFNKDGRDVTYMFTTRLRQILGLTLQYSDTEGVGISSSRLSSLVWPDKEKDKVKNSRGVAVNHLRKILAELDGAELRYEAGRFRFTAGDTLYCDYLECMSLLSGESKLNENSHRLLSIIGRGKFLKNFDEPIFDDFKQQVETRLETAISGLIKEAFVAGDYALTIEYAEAAFDIDPLSEQALTYAMRAYFRMRRENEARTLYHRYAEEYRKTNGERLASTFADYWG